MPASLIFAAIKKAFFYPSSVFAFIGLFSSIDGSQLLTPTL